MRSVSVPRFLTLAWALAAGFAIATSGNANTLADREKDLGHSAFPSATADRYSSPSTPALAAEVKKTLSNAVDVIRIHPAPWFAAALPGLTLSTAQIERVLQGAPGIPARICQEECKPCGSNLACLKAQDVGNELGTMIFVRKCALEQGGCNGTRLDLRGFLEESLGLFAHFKVKGLEGREKAEKNAGASSKVIRSTAASVNGLLSRCPGPYTNVDRGFLLSTGTMSQLGEPHRSCGREYRRVFEGLKKACPKKLSVPDTVRCDEKCQTLLCMAAGKAPQVRTFGSRGVLLLRPGSCEGSKPAGLEEFTRLIAKTGC